MVHEDLCCVTLGKPHGPPPLLCYIYITRFGPGQSGHRDLSDMSPSSVRNQQGHQGHLSFGISVANLPLQHRILLPSSSNPPASNTTCKHSNDLCWSDHVVQRITKECPILSHPSVMNPAEQHHDHTVIRSQTSRYYNFSIPIIQTTPTLTKMSP